MELAALMGVLLLLIAGLAWMAMRTGQGESGDPKPMSNQQLLSAIAGQADWLEKMSRSPIESQTAPSIVQLANKRRAYIGRLCAEVVARGGSDGGPINQAMVYPGATQAPNVFAEVAQYATELEAGGIGKEAAATRAVKKRLFAENGYVYPTSWEPT